MPNRVIAPIFLLFLMILAACAPTPTPTTQPTSSPSPSPNPSSTPRPTLANTPTATQSPFQACSPLHNYTPEQMPTLVANPYHPPPPGSDDPHAGVDLAETLPGTHVAVAGRAVQAVLDGEVAAVVQDRFPFGNALIIETPLDRLPSGFLDTLPVPTRAPTPNFKPVLSCPAFEVPASWDRSRRSLYLLYAHMQETPTLQMGDQVRCGQVLGIVGKTGNALNPHLHLEARVGPSGAQLGSMSHYDSSATTAELSSYCTWTVSGLFQVIDPLRLFLQSQSSPKP
jgi:murein DD-endopeptidase MepM/ murein hydrolase activator NlpD